MELATDAGAEDLEADPDGFSVTTAPSDLAAVRDALEAKGVTVKNAELTMLPDDDDRGRPTSPRRSGCCG